MPVTDLFSSPVLRVEHSPSDPNYQITDPEGYVLAHVSRAGVQPRRGADRYLHPSQGTPRAVVRVARPDGIPMFFVDRAEQREQVPVPPPCAIVAPDGRVVGRFEFDTRAWALSHLEGMSGFLGGPHSFVKAQQLFDAHQRQLCAVTWEKTRLVDPDSDGDPQTVGGRYCTFTDMNGISIARLDVRSTASTITYVLQLQYQLPEPLRTLVIATPVALGLWASGE